MYLEASKLQNSPLLPSLSDRYFKECCTSYPLITCFTAVTEAIGGCRRTAIISEQGLRSNCIFKVIFVPDPKKLQVDIQNFIRLALEEDIRDGDHSTLSSIPASETGKAVLKVKENGIIAGLDVAKAVFEYLNPDTAITFYKKDGDAVVSGDQAFLMETDVHTILMGERLALNIMQRMSGVASLTRQYVDKIQGFNCTVLDTRKTTPLFRQFEKAAVRTGGGANHRFGLYDMIMLKDNHIDYCGGITQAIMKAREYLQQRQLSIGIEVETRNIREVEEALAAGGIQRIMFDNFTPEDMYAAVDLVDNLYETEASGGITLDNIAAYAATGVQFISVGALTHHYVSMDLSLKAVK